jgi:hypothetical protein
MDELDKRIVAAVNEAGKAGVRLKDLATKVGEPMGKVRYRILTLSTATGRPIRYESLRNVFMIYPEGKQS